jgi:hypothetical protein
VLLQVADGEARSGHVLAAVRHATQALEESMASGDAQTTRHAVHMLRHLLPRIAHVTFIPPTGATGLNVTFDGQQVPADKLGATFSVDPGRHLVQAEGTIDGGVAMFDDEYSFDNGDAVIIDIQLVPVLSRRCDWMRCALRARNEDELERCDPKQYATRGLFRRLGQWLSRAADWISPR